jgi:hypothetical protein
MTEEGMTEKELNDLADVYDGCELRLIDPQQPWLGYKVGDTGAVIYRDGVGGLMRLMRIKKVGRRRFIATRAEVVQSLIANGEGAAAERARKADEALAYWERRFCDAFGVDPQALQFKRIAVRETMRDLQAWAGCHGWEDGAPE